MIDKNNYSSGEVHALFPTPVVAYDIDKDIIQSTKQVLLQEFKDSCDGKFNQKIGHDHNFKLRTNSVCRSDDLSIYQSGEELHLNKKLKPIIKNIFKNLDDYVTYILNGHVDSWEIPALWSNIYKANTITDNVNESNGGGLKIHNHGNSFLSGIVIIKDDAVDESINENYDKSSDAHLYFYDPLNHRNTIVPKHNPNNKVRYPSSDEFNVVGIPATFATPGKMIIFPSYLKHSASNNVSTSIEGDSLNENNLRITLAFNSFPRGEVGITNSSHLYL